MIVDGDRINGLPIRTEIRVPQNGEGRCWLTSVVVCQDVRKGTFVVWSVFDLDGQVQAENGIYGIQLYASALARAMERVNGRLI